MNRAEGAEGTVTTPPGGYIDDRPYAASPRDVRTPAGWALGLGALVVPSVAVRAGNAAGLQQALSGGGQGLAAAKATEVYAANVGAALFVLAGIAACIWLVRLQRVAVRRGSLDHHVAESALWVMWGLPFVNLVLPAVRIARLDRALLGAVGRRWIIWAWAVAWVPFAALVPRASDGVAVTGAVAHVPFLPEPGEPVLAWLRLAEALVSFAVWLAVVVRLTRAAERAEAQTVKELLGQSSRSPSTSR